MKQFIAQLKQHRRILLCVLACLAAFSVFALIWLTNIRGQGEKSSGWAINDQFHSYVPVEQQLVQEFTCDRDLYALSFVLAAQDVQTPPEGALDLVLEDVDTGEVLARSQGELRYIYNGWDAYYTTLGLDAPVELPSAGQRHYRVTLTPHYTGEGRLVAGYEEGGAPAGISLTADGKPVNGTLALKGTQARVGGFLTTFYWFIALGCIALLGAATWFVAGKKLPLHRLVFLLILGLGLLYNLVLPPYAAPDEMFHINQSFSLASSVYNPYLPVGKVPLHESLHRPSDQDPLLQDGYTTVFTWQRMAKLAGERNTDAWGVTPNRNSPQADNSYTLYLVSSAAVLLCFYLRVGFVGALFAGRLANLLFFAFLAAWTVKRTPVAKPVFALSALLPMTLHLAASFSRDSNLLALCFLFSAVMLDLAFGPRERLGWKQLLLPAVLGVVIAPSKLVYLPLIVLVFLIPAARLGRYSRLLKAGFVVLCLAAFLSGRGVGLTLGGFTQGSGQAAEGAVSSQAAEGLAGSQTASQAQQAEPSEPFPSEAPGGEAAPSLPEQDLVCYTLPYILSHPLDTLQLCVRSLVELGDHYVKTLVGGTLSYFNTSKDLNIAWTFVAALYLLLALAWLSPGQIVLPGRAKALCLFSALVCCGLAVVGCISWTPTYYTVIYGFQGRYLLPVLPLLLSVRPKRLTLTADCSYGLVYAAVLVGLGALLNAFLAVVAR